MAGALQEDVAVELVGIRVIVSVVALAHEHLAQDVVAQVSDVAEVVAAELLERRAADDVALCIAVVQRPQGTVVVLLQTFLAHPVGALHALQVGEVGTGQTEFLHFVVVAKLLVVAVAVGVMERGRRLPVIVDVPYCRQDIVVLPEIVGGLVPAVAVVHLVALSQIIAAGIACEIAFVIIGKVLIEAVVAAQSHVIHVFVGLDAGRYAIYSVHQTEVVVACGDSVPCLSGLLEVADILVSDGEIVVHPCQSAIVGARPPARSVDISVGICFVIGTVEDQMVPQQTR